MLKRTDTASTAGVDGGSYLAAERPDGFVWSSRRAGGGRGFAPRSPTTEHGVGVGGWRRATIVDGLLAVQVPETAAKSAGVTSVVELEVRPACHDDVVDETAVGEQRNSDLHQHLPD